MINVLCFLHIKYWRPTYRLQYCISATLSVLLYDCLSHCKTCDCLFCCMTVCPIVRLPVAVSECLFCCMTVCPTARLPVPVCDCLFRCMWLSAPLQNCLSQCLTVCSAAWLSGPLQDYLSQYLTVCTAAWLSVPLQDCLFQCLTHCSAGWLSVPVKTACSAVWLHAFHIARSYVLLLDCPRSAAWLSESFSWLAIPVPDCLFCCITVRPFQDFLSQVADCLFSCMTFCHTAKLSFILHLSLPVPDCV